MKKEILIVWKSARITVECTIKTVNDKDVYDIENLTFKINGFITNSLNELKNHCESKEDSELVELVLNCGFIWIQQKMLDKNIKQICFQSMDGYYVMS